MRFPALSAMLLTELHKTKHPRADGFTTFAAPRPGSDAGGVAVLIRSQLAPQLWRQRPGEGVLWVRLPVALPDGADLFLAVCYNPPYQRGGRSKEEAEEEEAGWWERLAHDWVAAARLGVPVVAGDFNDFPPSRTKSCPDFPPSQPTPARSSCDPDKNQRGRRLLAWCQEVGARICNGRVPGDERGAPTSWGVHGTGRSVVDYFLVPAGQLPWVRRLVVDERSAVGDHATLVLSMAGAPQPTHQSEPETYPCFFRFCRPSDCDRVAAAVDYLAASPELPALVQAAEAACTPEAVDEVARRRCLLVVAAMRAAGIRQQRASGAQQHPRGPTASPRHLSEQYHLPRLLKVFKAAKPGQARAAARKAWQRARGAARKALNRARATALEQLYLQQHDSHGFHTVFRPRADALPAWLLLNPDAALEHFLALLCPQTAPDQAPRDAELPATAVQAMRAGPQCAQLPQGRTDEIASLLTQMDAPFTAPEAVELAKRTPALKAAIGPLPPWLLKPAITAMAPLWAAEANAWRRVARLSRPDARSSITMLAKPGGAPVTPADFRGIAVSPVFPKLYAAGLARRVSAHAEAAGTHADGQFGFRPGRSTEQAALALRTLMDRYRLLRKPGSRQRGTKLWACFVDFKQAYDRVPREALWAKLALMGYSGEWLRAVQAIYAEVPMSVNVPGIAHRLIHTTIGLKQGCPLSPILFDLYIADFERRMLDAAAAGGFHLPELLPGYPAPPLFFADDCALLATTQVLQSPRYDRPREQTLGRGHT